MTVITRDQFREIDSNVRGMIGCAAMISAAMFVVVIIGSLFAVGSTIAERLMIALTMAGLAFVGALMLCMRDYARYVLAKRAVRRLLLHRSDLDDGRYAECFPDCDPALIVQTRRAVAEFFGAPAPRIHPTDRLEREFRSDVFEPGLTFFVVQYLFEVRQAAPRRMMIASGGLADMEDLAKRIQRLLDGSYGDGYPTQARPDTP